MHDKIRTESQLVRFTALLRKKTTKNKENMLQLFIYFFKILLPSSLLVDTRSFRDQLGKQGNHGSISGCTDKNEI